MFLDIILSLTNVTYDDRECLHRVFVACQLVALYLVTQPLTLDKITHQKIQGYYLVCCVL